MTHPLRILFAGTPDFAATTLAALLDSPYPICAVYTQPDRRAGRGRRLTAPPVKQLAQRHGLPVRQPTALRDPAVQAALADWQADVMVVVAYGLILPRTVLDLPRLGCLNIHASLLPRWRGAAPIQHAILAGDSETGISIMQMKAGLDTGPILHQVHCPITAHDTGGSLHDTLADLGAQTLLDTLATVATGTAVATPQDATQTTYAAKLDKAGARLDWTRTATELARAVRAFNPWPVSHTRSDEQALRVWRAQAIAAPATHARTTPGTIVHAGREGIDVATRDGLLRLLELQTSGGRAQPVDHFMNGHAALVLPGRQLV